MRTCTNPNPSNGGTNCSGISNQDCNIHSCSSSRRRSGGSSRVSSVPKTSKIPSIEKNNFIVPSLSNEGNFEILLNGVKQELNKSVSDVKKVIIRDNMTKDRVVEFVFDFNNNSLDLSNLSVLTGLKGNSSYVVVRGLDSDVIRSKIIRLPINLGSDFVCVKDAKVSSIDEISSDCESSSEYLIGCGKDVKIVENYSCVTDSN